MKCEKCGKELLNGASFCMECGTKARVANVTMPETKMTNNKIVECPHCGGAVYYSLDECPHCGGPIYSEAYEQEIETEIDELVEKQNKKEKKHFILSVIVAALFSVGFLEFGVASWFFGTVCCSIWFYGLTRVHAFRRFSNFLCIFPIGWFIFAVLTAYGSVLGGFYWFTQAVVNMIRRRPIISRNSYIELVNKGILVIE